MVCAQALSLGSLPVKALVIAGEGVAWCGVGTDIVVLHIATMKEVTRFDAQPDKVSALCWHHDSFVSFYLCHFNVLLWITSGRFRITVSTSQNVLAFFLCTNSPKSIRLLTTTAVIWSGMNTWPPF